VTSGDAKRRTGDAHTGTLDIARVNASAERETGVLHAGDSFARNGNAQPGIAMAGRIARELRVHIDQPRETRGTRKINRGDAVRELRRRR